MRLLPLILCGGSGTRLWPLSRDLYPKQLLALVDERSLLQNTVVRCAAYPEALAPLLVCNEEHRFLVAEQMRQIGVQPEAVLLEPAPRNTAPAIALGAMEAMQAHGDLLLAALPSDQLLSDQAAFLAALDKALALAREGYLVTFGVPPRGPETCYGYIRAGKPIPGGAGMTVARFVEKPALRQAKRYLAAGGHYWNSGVFVFKASRYLEELRACRPDIAEAAAQAMAGRREDRDFLRVGESAFRACPSESIDYAVMEKTRAAAMVPLDAGWSDIGSWDGVWKALPKDGAGNVVKGDVLPVKVADSYLHAEHRLLSVVGVSGLVVVETADAVLVAARDAAQEVKAVVGGLHGCGRNEGAMHRRVYRPWGHYENLDEGPGYKVKRLLVAPGQSLSLQRHRQRAEHWVVLSGAATVTRDGETFRLTAKESIDIPAGARHRLQNQTAEPVEIIEVQSGAYLGEDDIERFDDAYGRAGEES